LDALGAMIGEGYAGIADQTRTLKEIRCHHRLKHIQFVMSVGSADRDGNIVAHYLSGYHGERLALRWVNLSGHYRGTGFVFRNHDFADARTWPGGEHADVVGYCHQRYSELLQCTVALYNGVVCSQCFKFIFGGNKGKACKFGDVARYIL